MGLDQVTGDSQPDAATAASARARFIHPVKAGEDIRQVLGRDADAGIGDSNAHFFFLLLGYDAHFALSRGILQGVACQVEQHLVDAVLIDQHGRQIIRKFGL